MSIYKNQRGDTRTNIAGKIAYSRIPSGESFDAELYDTCHDGMGFVSKFPYLKDTEIFLKSKNEGENIIQRATVAWSRPLTHFKKLHPRYRVGVRYHH